MLTVVWIASALLSAPVHAGDVEVAQYDTTALLNQYRPDPLARERLMAEAAAQAPATDDPAILARFYHRRSKAAQALGLAQQRIDDLETALPFAQQAKLKPGIDGDELRILSDLANAWFLQNYRKAAEYTDRVLRHPNVSIGYVIGEHTKRASQQIALGDFAGAAPHLAQAEKALAEARTRPSWNLYGAGFRSYVDGARAYYLRDQGKYAEAEQLYRSAIALGDEDLKRHVERMQLIVSTRTEEDIRNQQLQNSQALAITLQWMGRLDEAELLMRDTLRTTLSRQGADAPRVIDELRALASILADQGRSRAALEMSQRAIEIGRKIGLQPAGFTMIWARHHYAGHLVGAGRFTEAIAEYESQQRDLANASRDAPSYVTANSAWAYALIRIGHLDAAITMLSEVTEHSSKVLGTNAISVGFARGYRAIALHAAGRREEALRDFRSALDILTGAEAGQLAYVRRSIPATRQLSLIAMAYIRLLEEIRGSELERRAGLDATAESFRLSDIVRGHSVQNAVAASAARAAAKSDELALLLRKEQDLTYEAESLYRFLGNQLSQPTEKQLPQVIADMRKRIGAIDGEQRRLAAEIVRRFPAYADFVNPQPPDVSRTRAALRANEALVNILVTATGTYVWAFRREGPLAFARSNLNTSEVALLIKSIRTAVDPGEIDIASMLPEVDLGAAHRLYAELLQPVAAGWNGADNLLVAASGALAQIPLAMLTTSPAGGVAQGTLRYSQFGEIPWLIREIAVTQIPTVNALLALRQLPPASPRRDAFIGFGDPQFNLATTTLPKKMGLRNLSIARVRPADTEEPLPASMDDYSRIPALPDTREEILAIARALRANVDADVFLGTQASRTNVLRQELSRRRIVAFATHGLLPGDYPGVSQPSLALANPGDGTHGLLTLEDILGLKLDADWVILSACNTAAGEGTGAEAISGLGRGFFYAGTRALLATYWPVESVSARLLVTGIFQRQAENPALSRAEALRQSILALQREKSPDGSYSYAHPLFWAPYALIGDGS